LEVTVICRIVIFAMPRPTFKICCYASHKAFSLTLHGMKDTVC
jgi:hypothetical protein